LQVYHLGVSRIVSAPDPSCELHVLLHEGNSPTVDGTQLSILKQSLEVALSSLLEGEKCLRLDSKRGVQWLHYVSNQPLE
jgi:hypothetical protein